MAVIELDKKTKNRLSQSNLYLVFITIKEKYQKKKKKKRWTKRQKYWRIK
jgi:hypothetical protein